MKIIKNNPYRTVGLLVGATAREQERQVRRLKQYIEVEQDPQDDFSFPSLGTLNRTVESVTEAASKLNLDNDKLNAALFWFYNGNAITDEPAFEAFKDSDTQGAIEIWSKLTSSGDVTQRNCSAFQNLSTLLLCNSVNGTSINERLFEEGVALKLQFLESDFVKDLKLKATDETFKTTKKEIQLSFLNILQYEVEKHGGISSSKLIDILSKQSFLAKDDFLKSFVQKPIDQIEKKIEAAKSKRKADKSNAANAGKELYDAVSNLVIQLKNILGATDLKYTSISDKVSDEILQCGIDYFLHYRDTNIDPGTVSMTLFKKAKNFAIGNIAKQRCDENTENLQEWIDDKPERDKQQKILADFERLKNIIDEYGGRSETVANAKQLLSVARPYLANVKAVLGSNDELYLGISSKIASDAQGMCVSEINNLQERFVNTYDSETKIASILLLKEKVNEAWDVTNTVCLMDLRADFRSRVNQNRTSLSDLKNQLSQVNTVRGRNSSSSGGCYIATMAYGDYDHPQVMELRKFRDEILSKNEFGRIFIRVYYSISPKFVSMLKNQNKINTLMRKALNQFIKLIK